MAWLRHQTVAPSAPKTGPKPRVPQELTQSQLDSWAAEHGITVEEARRLRLDQLLEDIRARRKRLCARDDSRGSGDAARRHR